MQIKAKLKVGSFLFGQGFSLNRGKESVIDSDSLTYADLSILASKVQLEQVESNVSADKLLELAEKVKPESAKVLETLFESTEEVVQEVIEVEVEEVKVEEKSEELSEEDVKLITENIEQAPNSVAVKSVKMFVEEGKSKDFFEAALKLEQSTKNRPSVIKAIKAAI